MNKASVGLVTALTLALAGCSGGTAAVAPKPRGKPGHVRVVNLSTDSVEGMVNVHEVKGLGPFEMTPAWPVAGGKKLKATLSIKGKPTPYEFKTESSKFVTLVVKPGGITQFISGESLTKPDVAVVDFVNLTAKPLSFKYGSSTVKVEPQSSKSLELPSGPTKIKAGSSATAEITVSGSEVWGAFAYERNGKISLGTAPLKKGGSPLNSGGPSAS